MIFSAGPIVKLGYISKPHGFDGRLKLHFTSNYRIKQEEPVFLMIQEKPVPFFIRSVDSREGSIISLESVETYEDAQNLIGTELYVTGSENTEVADFELIDYEVHDGQIGLIGRIDEVIDNGAQKLALLEYQGRECLIPIVPEIFVEISHNKRMIMANLPDGLLALSEANPLDDVDSNSDIE